MRVLWAVAGAAVLAGCSPFVETLTPSGGTVLVPPSYSDPEAAAFADDACAEHGRVSVVGSRTFDPETSYSRIAFDCVPDSELNADASP
jgi:hypothetical protein